MLFIFFICETYGSAVDVAYNIDNIIIGGNLPNDCMWIYDNEYRIAEKIVPAGIIEIDGLWWSVADVSTKGGQSGYSVGKPFTS